MKYYFILGIVLGVVLLIYSIHKITKIKRMKKITAVVKGYHSYMGRDTYVTRIQININGKEIEKDLNYYSIFISRRKGKKINVYYDENSDSVDCIYGNIFTLLLGLLFIVGLLYLMIKL